MLEELIGEYYDGVVHIDYFSANCSLAWNYRAEAQYYWAQLLRDIRFLLKHLNKRTNAWAKRLQDRSRKIFSAWYRRAEISDERFRRSILLHRDRFPALIRRPPDCNEARNLADRFAIVEYDEGDDVSQYDMSTDYFRFMLKESIEPTNNYSG